jgi:hypothetical protein
MAEFSMRSLDDPSNERVSLPTRCDATSIITGMFPGKHRAIDIVHNSVEY